MVKDFTAADKWLRHCFPEVKFDKKYEPTSEPTDRFNCIAWAMRFTDRWVQPSKGQKFWWPKYHSSSFDCSQQGLVEAFRKIGFDVCDNDFIERGYDKVALYYNTKTNTWTHAARVVGRNEYHSKAGAGYDFHHDNVISRLHNSSNIIESYGIRYVVMKRHKILRSYSFLLMLLRLIQKSICDPTTILSNIHQSFIDISRLIRD